MRNLSVHFDHPDADCTEGIAYIRDDAGRTVSALFGCDPRADAKTAATQRGYANLFSAAPELLEVLRVALKGLEIDGPASAIAALNTLGRAAIAKAQGETK